MKEKLRIRLYRKHASLLFGENKMPNNDQYKDSAVFPVDIDTDSDMMERLLDESHKLWNQGKLLFAGWNYIRKYSASELLSARLFRLEVRKYIEPCGKEMGTQYDESHVCPLCYTGGVQISPLRLRKGRYLYHKDVAITIGYEIIVSKRFVDMCKANEVKGIYFGPVYYGKNQSEDVFQLLMKSTELDISDQTRFGVNPCDFSEYDDNGPFGKREYYRCPNGDNLGLNILSEAYVKDCPALQESDFFISRHTYGVYRGLAVPRHLLFCSPRLMQLIKDNNIRGFDFEVAHVVD